MLRSILASRLRRSKSEDLILAEKCDVTYAQLVEKLGELGVHETEPNIRNKLARGKFTAAFMIECLSEIGCHTLRLDE